MLPTITFRALTIDDFKLMHRWFNTPHVQQFYSLRHWTVEEVEKKLNPYIRQEKPVFGFIIILDNKEIGYIQHYKINDFPWPEQSLSEEIIKNGAGLDFFIGETDLIGKGIGTQILKTILDQLIWPQFEYCIVDPDIRNHVMIRCNEKIGFKIHKIIHTVDALNNPCALRLMIIKKPGNKSHV